MLLAGRTAIIAGDAYGVGKAAALLFTREGASAVLIDDQAASKTASHVRIGEQDIPFIHADVTDSAQVQAAARDCEVRLGAAHILFNVAGRNPVRQTFRETTEDAWTAMLTRNLTSVFLCSKYFLPLLKRGGNGCIINHASIDARLGNPGIAAYSAAKGGVLPLTHCMARDLAEFGIRVNSLCTGGIRDPGDPLSSADHRRLCVTPAGRMATPDDIAKVALFLASDLAGYVNGTEIIVDGGRTATTHGCYDDAAGS